MQRLRNHLVRPPLAGKGEDSRRKGLGLVVGMMVIFVPMGANLQKQLLSSAMVATALMPVACMVDGATKLEVSEEIHQVTLHAFLLPHLWTTEGMCQPVDMECNVIVG